MHELAQRTWFRKPNYRANVIWHPDKSDATRVLQPKLLIKNSEHSIYLGWRGRKCSPTVADNAHKMSPDLMIESQYFRSRLVRRK